MFVKAGSIIPMKHDNFGKHLSIQSLYFATFNCTLPSDVLGSAQVIPDVIKLMIFPGGRYDTICVKVLMERDLQFS